MKNNFVDALAWKSSMGRNKRGGEKSIIRWEDIRKLCSSDEEADKESRRIAKEQGVNISYKGQIIEEYSR